MMQISIRQFDKKDIPNKVRWINDSRNNKYLHYDLPLEIGKTEKWLEKNYKREDRYDAVIEVDNIPVGIIGLINIDNEEKTAEYYITIGEQEYKGKGVAFKATKLILEYGFEKIGLKEIFLSTETENYPAIKMYEKVGFKRQGCKKLYASKSAYIYAIKKEDIYSETFSPIYRIGDVLDNSLYIKREDFIPISFGGNKARKAKLFFDLVDEGGFDCIVTYGSSSSNHCRIVANMCAARGLKCIIISPKGEKLGTYNQKMMNFFGAEIITCNLEDVSDSIHEAMIYQRKLGANPFFIEGGGHGNVGTQAFVDCYNEIINYEKKNESEFDYIFLASGTGTTQAGLVCGNLLNNGKKEIVGISIARKNPRGRDIVVDSVETYLREKKLHIDPSRINAGVEFVDKYVLDGYGRYTDDVEAVIDLMLKKHGVHLDPTYTGKAFWGMLEYIKEKRIKNKQILFLHTGGTPLFFDYLNAKG